MNDFKRKNNFGNGERRGGGGYPKRDFSSRPNGGGSGGFKPRFGGGSRDSGAPLELFPAVCASCGKATEVPFRPNGKKPVYCRECFAANGGQDGDAPQRSPERKFGDRSERRNDRPDRRDFGSDNRAESRPESFNVERKASDNGAMLKLQGQIESLNAKLDKLIDMIGNKATADKKSEAIKSVVQDALAAKDVSEEKLPEVKKTVKKFSKKK